MCVFSEFLDNLIFIKLDLAYLYKRRYIRTDLFNWLKKIDDNRSDFELIFEFEFVGNDFHAKTQLDSQVEMDHFAGLEQTVQELFV